MKIIVWNCNMAFRNKADKMLELQPDLLIIPECEHIDKIPTNAWSVNPLGALWFGHNQNKGLGAFAFNGYTLQAHSQYNEDFKIVAPISVSKEDQAFNLFAIWANHANDPDGRYVEQIWKAVHYYEELFQMPSILAGDFNSNTIWDKSHKEKSHSAVVDFLEHKGIRSAYHQFTGSKQGAEQHPSYYLHRKEEKAYHIDYCFLSTDILSRLKTVEVGDFDRWREYSDHVPLVVEIEGRL